MHSFISNHSFKFSRIHVRRIAAQCGIQLSDNYFSTNNYKYKKKLSFLCCPNPFFFLWRTTIFALIFDTLYKYFSFFFSFFSPHPLQIKLEFELSSSPFVRVVACPTRRSVPRDNTKLYAVLFISFFFLFFFFLP